MTKGELDDAKRRALNIFDSWNDVTGAVAKHASWMKPSELRQFPTDLSRRDIEPYISEHTRWSWRGDAPLAWHESVLRSFQVLQKVKHLLSIGTPAEVILEIIEESGE